LLTRAISIDVVEAAVDVSFDHEAARIDNPDSRPFASGLSKASGLSQARRLKKYVE
jgi:hypothetical protein